ncbi:MAG: cupin domain-containing protein [Sphingomonadales bacterium]|nr:cupin domain-containing protein [Sphingomonadales bacterium]
MEVDIGGRLRALRAARNLSQRELARRVGLPNSTISLIESGRSNPTIGALKRILDGLPIGLAEFFAYEPEAPRRFFFAAEELREIGRGRISYRQIGEGAAHALQMLDETYQPGADTGRVALSHQGEEAGLVLSGHLEVTVDGARKLLGPGDAYVFDSRLPHRFRNPGAEPCRVVSACTPPTF